MIIGYLVESRGNKVACKTCEGKRGTMFRKSSIHVEDQHNYDKRCFFCSKLLNPPPKPIYDGPFPKPKPFEVSFHKDGRFERTWK
jgi:galactose-1-phosphate uridylyltransferase